MAKSENAGMIRKMPEHYRSLSRGPASGKEAVPALSKNEAPRRAMRGASFHVLNPIECGRSKILEIDLLQRDHVLRPFRLAWGSIRFPGLRFQLVRRGAACT